MPELFTSNLPIVLCLISGIALGVLEMFLPGFGVAGISGILLEITAVVLTWKAYGYIAAIWMTMIILLVTGLLVFLSLRSAVKGRISKSKLILKETESNDAGYNSVKVDLQLLNQQGKTICALRPAGVAEIGGNRLNVVSEGDFIDAGMTVRVVSIEGNRIVVRPEV